MGSDVEPLSVPSMGTRTYPRKGLLISQFIFALNEVLKRVGYSPLCVADFLRNGTLISKSILVFRCMQFLNSAGILRPHWQLSTST